MMIGDLIKSDFCSHRTNLEKKKFEKNNVAKAKQILLCCETNIYPRIFEGDFRRLYHVFVV